MPSAVRDDASARTVVATLLPFTLAMFLGFLAVGIPLAVLPAFVHDRLGFGPVVTGIIAGLQSATTLLTRRYAGRLSDRRGPKFASLSGLASACIAVLCYLAAGAATAYPMAALGLLALGRLWLGLGESLFITALSAWSIAYVGQQHTGRALAWSGVAMYGALAIGAPLGMAIDARGGFAAVSACAMLGPVAGALLAWQWADVRGSASQPASIRAVLRLIWMPGLAMALASSGVGTITAFLALLYQKAGWGSPGLALTGFGAAYIAMRFLFNGLPDRAGGYLTALVSLLAEALGLALIWQASSPVLAFGGAALTGLGYSLVFPSLGVEALRVARPEARGQVLGTYLACFDLGIAIAGPAAGLVTQAFDLPSAFAAAALAAVAGMALTAWSWTRSTA